MEQSMLEILTGATGTVSAVAILGVFILLFVQGKLMTEKQHEREVKSLLDSRDDWRGIALQNMEATKTQGETLETIIENNEAMLKLLRALPKGKDEGGDDV